MLSQVSIDELSRVIGIATAPAFLLGAVAGLLSLLVGRLSAIMERSRKLHAIEEHDPKRAYLRADIPRIMRQAGVMRIGVVLCAVSGIVTGWMVVLTFLDALFGMQNNQAIVLMFLGAVTLFTTALFFLIYETILASGGFAHFDG